MHSLKGTKIALVLLHARASLPCSSFPLFLRLSSVRLATSLVWRRPCSNTAVTKSTLFEYTSGRWLINDALRRAERRRIFNVDELCRLAAQAVHRRPSEVAAISKLGEGGFNRAFTITMSDGFRMVARIPYPVTVPRYYAVASEVATMDFLRSSGLPIPQVYGYSPDSDNAAGTEYIFMEYVQAAKLSDVWRSLGDQDVDSIVQQLTEIESKIMSLSFPAGGSLYYTKDLDKLASGQGIPLKDERFCVGPDTRLHLWYGKRERLEVDRGPYASAEAALVAPALKELAYLDQFGQPLLPFRRERRAGYQYQEQSPLDHIQNLNRYLRIAPTLVAKNPILRRFCMRHPDFHPGNVFVSQSPDSSWRVVSLFDWQHTSILPLFLHAGIPQRLLHLDDPILTPPPTLSDNFADLDELERSEAEGVYRSRLTHHLYVKYTKKHNLLHYTALTNPNYILRSRLFTHAGAPWEGETLDLKVTLMEAAKKWETLTGDCSPCPIAFDADDVRETRRLNEVQADADNTFEAVQNMLGLGPEGWVPTTDDYEKAVALSRQLKEAGLSQAASEEEYREIVEHWPWDDMDEEKYMQRTEFRTQ